MTSWAVAAVGCWAAALFLGSAALVADFGEWEWVWTPVCVAAGFSWAVFGWAAWEQR